MPSERLTWREEQGVFFDLAYPKKEPVLYHSIEEVAVAMQERDRQEEENAKYIKRIFSRVRGLTL